MMQALSDFTDALPVGSEIGGYVVRRLLGHGGFGITYEADNRVTGRSVAIKEFFPASFAKRYGASELVYSKADEETIAWALRKFEETTTTLCRLSHPNIVQVVHYVPANNTGYMIMELVRGRTLKEWLKSRNGKSTLDELRPLLEPVMDALTYVHGEGLVHRDVAPDNILITGDGRPVLIDFGSISADLSRDGNERAKSTVGLSKRHFTAPEQMNSKTRPTMAADIYSVGAVLYLALCGDEPMDGQDRMHAVFLRQELDPYVPLARMHPAVAPPAAAALIDTSLAMRPDQRPGTMAAMRQGLWQPFGHKQVGGVAAAGGAGTSVPSIAREHPDATGASRAVAREPIDVRPVAALAPARSPPNGTIFAAALGVGIALIVTAYLLVWPRPHSQASAGDASQSAGSGTASLGTQTGPTSSTVTRPSDPELKVRPEIFGPRTLGPDGKATQPRQDGPARDDASRASIYCETVREISRIPPDQSFLLGGLACPSTEGDAARPTQPVGTGGATQRPVAGPTPSTQQTPSDRGPGPTARPDKLPALQPVSGVNRNRCDLIRAQLGLGQSDPIQDYRSGIPPECYQ